MEKSFRLWRALGALLFLSAGASAALAANAPSAPPAAAAPAAEQPPPEAINDPAPKETDPTARQILANFIIVEGGPAHARQLALVQITGNETPLPKGAPITQFTYWIAPPGRARLDTTVPQPYGKTKVTRQVVDGADAWTFDPAAKIPVPAEVPAAQLGGLAQLADLFTPFLDDPASARRYQYAGQEKFRGLNALVVKYWAGPAVTSPEYLYFDSKTFLLLRLRREMLIGNERTWANTYITKYDSIGNFWVPTVWEHALGDAVFARSAVATVQFIPQVDAALFARPAPHEIVLGPAAPVKP